MTKNKLGNVVNIKTGKLDANASSPDGDYPFFTCSREPLKISSYSYDSKCVLVAGNGDLNVKYYEGKFDAYQRTYIIESKDETVLDTRYLYWFLFKYVEKLRELSIGGVIKYIKLNNLTDPLIPLPSLTDQKHIVNILDKANTLCDKRKQAFELLDEYLKSVFLKMFGETSPEYNSWKPVKFKELVKKSKGSMRTGPFGSDLLHSEFVDSGVAVIGIDNAVQNKFAWDQRRFITQEKYEKLRRYTLFPRDIIITIMGTVGRTAVIPKDIPLAINTKHLAALTLDDHLANPYFISYSIHSNPLVVNQISHKGRGAIMTGLNLGIIKDLQINLPPVEKQNEFELILKKTESLKQKMLAQSEELEKQFQALMQKAFKGTL